MFARRIDTLPEGVKVSSLETVALLSRLAGETACNHHVDLFESARPIGGMAWEEWRRRCLNCTREVRGALVTRLPGTRSDLVVTLKDGRTYNVWWETGKGWHVLTCIGGTMHRTRTIDPNGKTGAEVLSVTREAFSSYFVQRPDRLAYEHDMGEVFAPVTHDDGTPDKRYTVCIEGTGTPERRGHLGALVKNLERSEVKEFGPFGGRFDIQAIGPKGSEFGIVDAEAPGGRNWVKNSDGTMRRWGSWSEAREYIRTRLGY